MYKLSKIRFSKAKLLKYQHVRFSKLIPSILTFLALVAGLNAIRFAMEDQWEFALIFIVSAAILDGLDGRIARLLNATTSFGAELDSLCDFVNFGVAPGLVLYMWIFQNSTIKLLGWVAVLFYIIAMGARLARFNITFHDPQYLELYKKFFLGIPAPIGGILLMIPIMLDLELMSGYHIKSSAILVATYTLLVSFLVASRIPTPSIKTLSIKREYVWFVIISSSLLVTLLFIYPWHILPLLGGVYLCTIPLSYISAHRLKKIP